MSNKDTFTRQELFELLSASYPSEKILAGLQELAKTDPSIDPDGEEFDVEVSDRLERLFNLAQKTLDQSKLLGGGSNLANIQTQAIESVSEQLQIEGVSRETFKAFLDIVAGKAVAKALAVHQFEQELFNQIKSELDVESLQQQTQAGLEEVAFIYQLAKNPEIRQRITQDYGLKTAQEIRQEVQTLTNSATSGFDPKAFLDEIGVPTPEKKSTQPTTIQDMKNLTRSLLSKQLQSPA
ncbi:hypothetical protein H6G80_31320 [Nostoc sp. FACHB-87]|uniref:hypothetical protein n=1 Tax=Nostocales TaxID=1161 RepID=UPI00168595A3|nr:MULTISPECIES: hypothetical protein [Nostocales]MBD2302598.1 hypothetical protein [Nostoc sp. FACHB-190]MBD2458544.1 hypothetical protein [Nostoc sp. FACHB-87]MBD2479624.1 hypothetical protein [Anabaena sp. FACHB-83]MBD2492203.1 hypothetical protein [Aulosira sp. FACHB-615]